MGEPTRDMLRNMGHAASYEIMHETHISHMSFILRVLLIFCVSPEFFYLYSFPLGSLLMVMLILPTKHGEKNISIQIVLYSVQYYFV